MRELVQVHNLKVNKEYWEALTSGVLKFTVRRDDRGFQKGDMVRMYKYDAKPSKSGEYYDQSYFRKESNNERTAKQEEGICWTGKITYILTGGQFGIEPGYVVLGIEPAEESKEKRQEKELRNRKMEKPRNARDIMPMIDYLADREDDSWIDEAFSR